MIQRQPKHTVFRSISLHRNCFLNFSLVSAAVLHLSVLSPSQVFPISSRRLLPLHPNQTNARDGFSLPPSSNSNKKRLLLCLPLSLKGRDCPSHSRPTYTHLWFYSAKSYSKYHQADEVSMLATNSSIIQVSTVFTTFSALRCGIVTYDQTPKFTSVSFVRKAGVTVCSRLWGRRNKRSRCGQRLFPPGPC